MEIRLAKSEDLDGIMAIEEEAFAKAGYGTIATYELMQERITLCNTGVPGWFYVAVQNGEVEGYAVYQPTRQMPDQCTTWELSTDNGTLKNTFDPKGETVFGVSIGTKEGAPAHTADMLLRAAIEACISSGKKRFMFCSRLPGFQDVALRGVAPEEYWQLKDESGAPKDWLLKYFHDVLGVFPCRFLRNGYVPDIESGGHAALVVVEDLKRAMRLLNARNPELIASLQGGSRNWYDVTRQCMVRATTVFVAYGCPDWGNPGGVRNRACTFCPLPQQAEKIKQTFSITDDQYAHIFAATLSEAMRYEPYDTLNIFNAGSLPAMWRSNVPLGEMMREVTRYPSLRRVVIESRAPLVTEEAILPIFQPLQAAGIALTVRIGIESQDDNLRLRVLRKGHRREELEAAAACMRKHGIQSGAYVMLNPAPGLDPRWAEDEAMKTFDFVLRDLRMDEVYFGPTCVGPETRLAEDWRAGRFTPPDLWSVYRLLTRSLAMYGKRVHLLRFTDEPPFIAVPSNHVLQGIPESLDGAQGCDLEFHAMLDAYRETMDPAVLYEIECSCAPKNGA